MELWRRDVVILGYGLTGFCGAVVQA